MKKIIIFFIFLFFLIGLNTLSFSQEWVLQAEEVATQWQAIDAVDSNVAVAISRYKKPNGGEGIFRTLDGGNSWHEITWHGECLVHISIVDSSNFWVITPFSIYYTFNAGHEWELQYSGDSTTSWFNYIEMFDQSNGIAMGDALPGKPVLILKTSDSGKNWISQNHSHFVGASCLDVWRCIDFVSPDVGYGRFTYTGVPLDTVYLQKTIDGGKTWMPTPLCVRNFTLVHFFDEKIGLATWKANFPLYRTTDGGNRWKEIPLDSYDEWPEDIEFFPNDPSKVLLSFGSHLFFSSDTGKSWVELLTPDVMWLWDIKMVDDKHGWIVGERGIIHTSTGGVTSVQTKKSILPEEFVLYQNYPNPFNLSTIIRFSLNYPDFVSLKVYNLIGEEVAVLLNKQPYQTGHHSVKYTVTGLSSGIYFYKLISSQNTKTRRMIVIK